MILLITEVNGTRMIWPYDDNEIDAYWEQYISIEDDRLVEYVNTITMPGLTKDDYENKKTKL